MKSRLQYLGPQPGIPVLDDEHVKGVHLDPLAGPVDAFCLMVLDPEKVKQTFFFTFLLLLSCFVLPCMMFILRVLCSLFSCRG